MVILKLISFTIIFLSIITFRQCGEPSEHDDVTLSVDPVYSAGVLSVSPYVIYEGEDPAVFQFGSSIAWIEKITNGEDVIYKYDGEEVDVDQQTTMEEDDEREGFTVEIDTAPGTFHIHMTAEFMEVTEEGELQEFSHGKVQVIEIRSEEEE